jgi:D-glycero-alpha-D-manno-heptose-7-phosphate kinase
LEQQSHNTRADQNSKAILAQMVGIARALKESLEKNRLNDFGDLLHQNWELKKKLADNISNPVIDRWYSIARQKGAIGGKILGAGGGGFLLLYAPKAKHRNICRSLSKLKPFAFGFDPEGSKIIYYGER